jgi:hypothetical protein
MTCTHWRLKGAIDRSNSKEWDEERRRVGGELAPRGKLYIV